MKLDKADTEKALELKDKEGKDTRDANSKDAKEQVEKAGIHSCQDELVVDL